MKYRLRVSKKNSQTLQPLKRLTKSFRWLDTGASMPSVKFIPIWSLYGFLFAHLRNLMRTIAFFFQIWRIPDFLGSYLHSLTDPCFYQLLPRPLQVFYQLRQPAFVVRNLHWLHFSHFQKIEKNIFAGHLFRRNNSIGTRLSSTLDQRCRSTGLRIDKTKAAGGNAGQKEITPRGAEKFWVRILANIQLVKYTYIYSVTVRLYIYI